MPMKSNYNSLFSKIESSELKKYPLLSCCVKDGVLIPERYEKSPLKILFVLKEPYSDWDEETGAPSNCNFNFSDIVDDLDYHYEKGLNRTWLKVSAIAYSLKNKTPYSENLSYEQVVDGLSCVAWINLSKTPWHSTTKMDSSYIKPVRTWEPVVKAQFSQINADIIFYGNTWDFSFVNPIEPDIPWNNNFCTDEKTYEYQSEGGNKYRIFISKYRDTNKILVNGYHPEFGNSADWQTEFIKDYLEN